MGISKLQGLWVTCNPHKFEIPTLWFPYKPPVNPCKHLQCMLDIRVLFRFEFHVPHQILYATLATNEKLLLLLRSKIGMEEILLFYFIFIWKYFYFIGKFFYFDIFMERKFFYFIRKFFYFISKFFYFVWHPNERKFFYFIPTQDTKPSFGLRPKDGFVSCVGKTQILIEILDGMKKVQLVGKKSSARV